MNSVLLENLSERSWFALRSLMLRHLQGHVIDAAKGATRGLRRQKPGIAPVLTQLSTNIPAFAETLGLPADTHTQINTVTERLEQVRAARTLIAKWAEVSRRPRIFLEDEREGQIGLVVNAVRGASRRKDPGVVASFEETIRYHGQIATRAAKTRRKNAESGPDAEEPAPEA